LISIGFTTRRGATVVWKNQVRCEGGSVSKEDPVCSKGRVDGCLPEESGSICSRVKLGRWGFYAVKRGRKVGIFRSWPECEKQIRYYSGVVFKGFHTEKEANLFMKL
jgi:hypothetical protein